MTTSERERERERERKMKMGDFRSKIDPKPPLNEEVERENLKRKTKTDLLERKRAES
jgi:hypothetical protein